MSGEAGARIEGQRHAVFLGSGVNVSVATPPGDDGSAVGRYFDAANAPYGRWLARAAADLERLFAAVHAEGRLPLVDLGQPVAHVDGTIIEPDDRKAQHFARHHRGGPLALSIGGNDLLPDHRSLRVAIAVTGRVHRRDLDDLLARVAAVLLTHAADPPEPPPVPHPAPEPPPAPPSWAARLRRWLSRG